MQLQKRPTKIYHVLTHWQNFRLRLFGEGIVIGVVAGLTIILFRYSIEQAELLRTAIFIHLHAEAWPFTVLWFLCLLGISYILGLIVRIEPMSAGSGIPQVRGTILGLMKMNWLRIVLSKFLGGVLAIGAGLSLGREGPSIQLGATLGQGLSRLAGRTRMEERYLLTSGASAGLAAAFNAPLAGVIFSLEELHKNFSPVVLIPAVTAALTADAMTQYFFGHIPIFNFTGLPVFPLRYYGVLIVLGVVTGILGIAFNRVLIKTLDIFEKQNLLSGMGKIALPLLIAGIAGFFLPEILGGGNGLVGAIAANHFGLKLLAILLMAKFLFTMISYGSGAPGGIFLPMLVIGALTGGVFNSVATQFGGLDPHYGTNIIVFSMAAYFTAVVKAPITGSILIMEMTGSFEHMLSLIFVSMASYLVAEITKSKPIYEQLLERSLEKSRGLPGHKAAEKQMVVELVVCLGSKLNNQQVKRIDWPVHCLLVNIKRGDMEIVPDGNTRIMTGDYLYVLASTYQVDKIRALAEECVFP
ncbi:MAG TPA: chloride channel protein [Negativicutes bacterium]|nr:chloride channel protein [Negativicutes bacterium]